MQNATTQQSSEVKLN
jgi:hypothetical protein